MATYIPNATDVSQPVESQTVESAALEFRTLKTRTNALETSLGVETTARIQGDQDILDYVSPYVTAAYTYDVLAGGDLGLVTDSTIVESFDFGGV
jgi:hypothetical protein